MPSAQGGQAREPAAPQHIPHPWAFRASPSPPKPRLTQTTATSSACQPEPQMDHETPRSHHRWYTLLCQDGFP